MNRRLLTILTATAVATLTAGCSTLDTDTVARVGDAELGQAQLDDLISVVPNATQTGPSDPDNVEDVRQTINIWLRGKVTAEALDDADVELDPLVVDQVTSEFSETLPGFTELSDVNKDLIITLVAGQQALTLEPPEPAASVLDLYAKGPRKSGLICVSHILLDDVETADLVKAELDNGADFASTAAQISTDTGSAQQGGDLGCFVTADFETLFIPEFVEGALDAAVGVATEPVPSEFGAHIILVREADATLASFLASTEYRALKADVSVNSRYGTFDPSQLAVLPFG